MPAARKPWAHRRMLVWCRGLILLLKACAVLQVIVFALSKRQCEELAGHLASAELTTPDEATLVERIFWSAMDVLSVEDRRLPQVPGSAAGLTSAQLHASLLCKVAWSVCALLREHSVQWQGVR